MLASLLLVAVACARLPHAPPEHTKIAVVEFSVAPNANIENFGGDAASLGMPLAETIAEELRDDDLDAQAIPRAVPADGDLTVRGEITHVWGGNTAARWIVGFAAGSAGVGSQGTVTKRDGTVVGVFSEEKIGNAWGEASSVLAAARRTGVEIGEMVKKGAYRGGHPGNDGYLAPGPVAASTAVSQGAPRR